VAVVASHAIQYVAPWLANIAATGRVDLRTFYLWDFGVQPRYDREFQRTLEWDIPLLDGYASEYVKNASADPGTHHFRGLDNPDIVRRVAAMAPDVIVLFGYHFLSFYRLMLSPALSGIPMFLRGDSNDLSRPGGFRPMLARVARRMIFKRFARVLAVGTANAQYYRTSGVPDEKIALVPHCVDNDRFASTNADSIERWKLEHGIPFARPVILYAGKFDAVKRPLDLVEAFLRLPRSGDPHEQPALVMVGSGLLEEQIRTAAGDRLGLDVFIVPFQNQTMMPIVYAAADLFVLPSRSETWGLAVNEAMSAGRPVIVSSTVGCAADLVVPDRTGWTFTTGNVDALAGALRNAMSDRAHLSEMGANARRHIQNYSYDVATSRLIEAVESVYRASTSVH